MTHSCLYTHTHTHRHTDTQTHRHTDTHTHTHTHTHTRAQAAMQAMGVAVNKTEASLSHPPLTCYAAQLLTGHESVPVHDPEAGNS